MSYLITVTNLENKVQWQKNCTYNEFFQVNEYKGKEVVWLFEALIKPIRTNNLKNFVIDMFIPVTLTRAIKVNHVAGKVLAVLTALFFDLITLPIRLITCIPRERSNAKLPEDLLLKYLKSQNVDPKLLESDHVYIRFDSEVLEKGVKRTEYLARMVNFIEQPVYEWAFLSESGSLHS